MPASVSVLQRKRTTRIYICVCVRVCVCTHLNIYVCVCIYKCIYIKRFISRNWLMLLGVLTSLGFVGPASRPETLGQELILKSAGRSPFFLREIPVLFLGLSTDWVIPTHIIKNNLLNLSQLFVDVNHDFEIPSQ